MDEDEEEFYDSLEEDQKFEDTYSDPPEYIVLENEKSLDDRNENQPDDNKIAYKNEIAAQNKSSQTSIHESEDENKRPTKSTKIPLYVGETDKKDLKINKKCSYVTSSNQLSNTCLPCDTGKCKLKNDVVQKKKQESSYWNIYCQKNRLPLDEDIADTVRSMYGSTTTRTFSSLISSCCLSGQTWDAPSMFEKYIPKKYAALKKGSPTYEVDEDSIAKCSSDLDVENFKSVSQIDIVKTSASPSRMSNNKIMKSKSNTSNISLRPLSLKSLCPDQSKLDLIRRQHEYGHRASSRNRARFIQNLSKLKQEIQGSTKEKMQITR